MKYQNAKLRQMLAAEYALGTLHGRARRRFERLLRADAGLRAEAVWWEQRLAGLAGRIAPVAPRGVVWAAIDRQVNAVAPVVSAPRARVNFWRTWSAVSTAAAVVLGFGLWQELQRGPQIIEVPKIVAVQAPSRPMPYVAVLQPAQSKARWLVSLYPDRGVMRVSASGGYSLDELRHSLELWVIEGNGPRSLGVLPNTGDAEMPLPAGLPAGAELTLAISLEPHGGSPTGQPTGPVILAAPALRAL